MYPFVEVVTAASRKPAASSHASRERLMRLAARMLLTREMWL